MTAGPGKYDDICTLVREKVGIKTGDPGGVIIIVVGGNKGPGFSVQSDYTTLIKLPEMLIEIAKQLHKDMGGEIG